MKFTHLDIEGLMLIEPSVFGDERGFFLESFRQDLFEKYCGDYQFVQDNHSCSTKGILRGLHYQIDNVQGKLVRVTEGSVFDVAVDMRRNSSTFGRWHGQVLSAQNKQMLWVPPGFAHGFYVMSNSAHFLYKCTEYYSPESEVSILWSDPSIGVEWPFDGVEPLVSEKDRRGLSFSDAPSLEVC